eukprot:CAMPEP_0182544590 /NCGR_PEP_ID=MMETSP1323-20130603/33376_1 /TAXON_ID=236787 /ORGANISM="Florenciella parvula, Strain RCC1693" /LENGTH=110 /DNA_ID=CAMNT_0024755651 /DNA_START=107 /DNA_END=440 /DNA_ORIENTATION=-
MILDRDCDDPFDNTHDYMEMNSRGGDVSAAGALHPHATIAARTAGTAGVEVVAEAHQTRSIWIRSISGRGPGLGPGLGPRAPSWRTSTEALTSQRHPEVGRAGQLARSSG